MMLAKVINNYSVFGDYGMMDVASEGIGLLAKPGQFFMVKVGAGSDPLLRRPFSLHRIVSPDSVRFLYRRVGKGTALMSRMVPGDELDILGPLGKGFPVWEWVDHALLVGGGIGIAPLVALADNLVTHRRIHTVCFIGGRTSDDILGVMELRRLGVKTYLSTEDGSLPRKGRITESLEEYISKHARYGVESWAIYSCGPKPMMKAVAGLARERGIRDYTSLEANMACGVGACLGCVTRVMVDGKPAYKKVCEDGPVFEGAEVIW